MDGLGPYGNGKNGLGLGKNATGLLLGGIFVAVYFGSKYGTEKWVMKRQDLSGEAPKMFRDINIKADDDGGD